MNYSRAPQRIIRAWMLIVTVVFGTMFAADFSHAQSRTGFGTAARPAGLMLPKELLNALQSGSAKPIVLYVGPHILYAQAHIRGAEFIGPASESQSLATLRKRAASLPKNAPIVLYCGCCPWEHCPNIRPAYDELQKAGFTRVKALYLADSFGTDWVDKGYPVEKGH